MNIIYETRISFLYDKPDARLHRLEKDYKE